MDIPEPPYDEDEYPRVRFPADYLDREDVTEDAEFAFYMDEEMEPERDVDLLTNILESAHVGMEIEFTFGFHGFHIVHKGEVTKRRTERFDNAGEVNWDFTLEFKVDLPDEQPSVFRTGIGDDDLAPWAIAQYEYHPGLGVALTDTQELRGWIIEADLHP
jgi:hypothetical protein